MHAPPHCLPPPLPTSYLIAFAKSLDLADFTF